MQRNTRLVTAVSLAAALAVCVAVPSAALGKKPSTPSTKNKPAKKTSSSINKETSPDDISAGGKTLSQWRAMFGEDSNSSDTATIFSKPNAVAKQPLKPNIQRIRSLPARQEERLTAERILVDALKVYWTRLAVIANNMANVDTIGYKRNRVLIEGTVDVTNSKGNDWSMRGQLAKAGISASGGGPVFTIQTDFRQGRLKKTGRMLDIAIEGKGFLQVINQKTGETHYTRAGNLSVNNNGELTVGPGGKGWLIEPSITIPQDTTSISFSADGSVDVKQPGSPQMNQVGQLQLAFFINPEGMQRLGGKLFGETDASGSALTTKPGQDSCGVICQGHLEQSNVDLDKERDDWTATTERIKMLEQMLPK
ncbi:MAG: flagellar hook-basal body complex protein [Pirellulales bacterium]|nr:flagellar hook-basal body complex protein [Pirellulales bacterium]